MCFVIDLQGVKGEGHVPRFEKPNLQQIAGTSGCRPPSCDS